MLALAIPKKAAAQPISRQQQLLAPFNDVRSSSSVKGLNQEAGTTASDAAAPALVYGQGVPSSGADGSSFSQANPSIAFTTAHRVSDSNLGDAGHACDVVLHSGEISRTAPARVLETNCTSGSQQPTCLNVVTSLPRITSPSAAGAGSMAVAVTGAYAGGSIAPSASSLSTSSSAGTQHFGPVAAPTATSTSASGVGAVGAAEHHGSGSGTPMYEEARTPPMADLDPADDGNRGPSSAPSTLHMPSVVNASSALSASVASPPTLSSSASASMRAGSGGADGDVAMHRAHSDNETSATSNNPQVPITETAIKTIENKGPSGSAAATATLLPPVAASTGAHPYPTQINTHVTINNTNSQQTTAETTNSSHHIHAAASSDGTLGEAGAAASTSASAGSGIPQAAPPRRRQGCRDISTFTIVKTIGAGTFGTVALAIDPLAPKTTGSITPSSSSSSSSSSSATSEGSSEGVGQHVALKKIQLKEERHGFPINIVREIKAMQAFAAHPQFVRLREIVTSRPSRDNAMLGDVFLCMDYVDHDLSGLIAERAFHLSPAHVKSYMHQLLSGLAHMHAHGWVHRDLKPANLLVTVGNVIKIADFGLSRCIDTGNPKMTPGTCTLWYRAPEVLLHDDCQGTGMDVWAAGCIMGDMLLRKALFCGEAEEKQMEQIYKLVGEPDKSAWPGLEYMTAYQFLKPRTRCSPQWTNRFKDVAPLALDLLQRLLCFSPHTRITAAEALKHPYFAEGEGTLPPDRLPPITLPSSLGEAVKARHKAEKDREAMAAAEAHLHTAAHGHGHGHGHQHGPAGAGMGMGGHGKHHPHSHSHSAHPKSTADAIHAAMARRHEDREGDGDGDADGDSSMGMGASAGVSRHGSMGGHSHAGRTSSGGGAAAGNKRPRGDMAAGAPVAASASASGSEAKRAALEQGEGGDASNLPVDDDSGTASTESLHPPARSSSSLSSHGTFPARGGSGHAHGQAATGHRASINGVLASVKAGGAGGPLAMGSAAAALLAQTGVTAQRRLSGVTATASASAAIGASASVPASALSAAGGAGGVSSAAAAILRAKSGGVGTAAAMPAGRSLVASALPVGGKAASILARQASGLGSLPLPGARLPPTGLGPLPGAGGAGLAGASGSGSIIGGGRGPHAAAGATSAIGSGAGESTPDYRASGLFL